ncbi:MAG: hypothetical protein WAM58_09535 [Candidatus Acidiferrum sp.]
MREFDSHPRLQHFCSLLDGTLDKILFSHVGFVFRVFIMFHGFIVGLALAAALALVFGGGYRPEDEAHEYQFA